MTVSLLNISFTEVSLWHWLTRHSLSSCFYRDFLLLVLISHKREEFPWQSNIPLFNFSAYTVVALICCCFFNAFCVCLFFIGKNRRLKQAKEEAQAEIEQYRLQREKEFKTKEAAVRFIHFCFRHPFLAISLLLYLHGRNLVKRYFGTLLWGMLLLWLHVYAYWQLKCPAIIIQNFHHFE